MISNNQRVDFLIAGVQKAGTTALWHFLKQHPHIQFGKKKELHFFDNDKLNWKTPDYDILHNKYEESKNRRMRGDATPNLTYWPPAMQRIQAYNPDMKIIILLRNPAERAYSHWKMQVTRQKETLSFSEVIRRGPPESELAGVPIRKIRSYVERGFYADQLERAYSLFPEEQIIILQHTAFMTKLATPLKKITSFLDIPPFKKTPQHEIFFANAGTFEPITEEDRRYLNDIYQDSNNALKNKYDIEFHN